MGTNSSSELDTIPVHQLAGEALEQTGAALAGCKLGAMKDRSYGRAADQMRPITIEPGFVRTANGSALISMGETRVICTASVQESVPRWLRRLPDAAGSRRSTGCSRRRPESASSATSARASAGRSHGRDPAADRPLAARRGRLRGARRAHDLHRLRRPAGRRRHSLRLDHRRHGRARAGDRDALVGEGRIERSPLTGTRRRGLRAAIVDGVAAARPRLLRGLDRRGRRQRRHDRRRAGSWRCRPPPNGRRSRARTSTICWLWPPVGIGALLRGAGVRGASGRLDAGHAAAVLELVLATRNEHKLAEVRRLLAQAAVASAAAEQVSCSARGRRDATRPTR